jgi:CheY-like chemotaxis protein
MRIRWYETQVSRVLIVDDEADVRFVVRRAFESAGQEVIEAVHGADAVATIGETRPDLVVTDIMMPVMDGRQLIVWLRARVETLGIPILALTGFSADHVGADRVVRKPFVPAQVRDVGLALLDREG